MPYINLVAPDGTTAYLTSTRADTIRSWFDEWLPKFTGWPGLEGASCTCQPSATRAGSAARTTCTASGSLAVTGGPA